MFSAKQFNISEEEWQKIKEWDETHECIYKPKYGNKKYSGAIGGHLSITFLPTSIGTIVTVKCGCKKELNVRDIK